MTHASEMRFNRIHEHQRHEQLNERRGTVSPKKKIIWNCSIMIIKSKTLKNRQLSSIKNCFYINLSSNLDLYLSK